MKTLLILLMTYSHGLNTQCSGILKSFSNYQLARAYWRSGKSNLRMEIEYRIRTYELTSRDKIQLESSLKGMLVVPAASTGAEGL